MSALQSTAKGLINIRNTLTKHISVLRVQQYNDTVIQRVKVGCSRLFSSVHCRETVRAISTRLHSDTRPPPHTTTATTTTTTSARKDDYNGMRYRYGNTQRWLSTRSTPLPKVPGLKKPLDLPEGLDPLTVCGGCGARFQMLNTDQAGYIPEKVYHQSHEALAEQYERSQVLPVGEVGETDAVKPVVCYRCHSLTHYREDVMVPLNKEKVLSQLEFLKHQDGIILLLLDIFDFTGSWIPDLDLALGGQKVVVAVNKIDLLPKDVSHQRIEKWVWRQIRSSHLRDNVESVVLVSSLRNHGVEQARKKCYAISKKGQNIYVVGCTNVGKSTFINALLHRYARTQQRITTSILPGTTLDTITIPLANGQFIHDTPGIVSEGQITRYLSMQDLASVVMRKGAEARTFRVTEQQSFFLAGFARIDYLSGPPLLFTFYTNPKVPITARRGDKANDYMASIKGKTCLPDNSGKKSKDIKKGETGKVTNDNVDNIDGNGNNDCGGAVQASHALYPSVSAMINVTPQEWERGAGGQCFLDLAWGGLGWVSIQAHPRLHRYAKLKGSQPKMTFQVWAPPGILVQKREPLLPFEIIGDTRTKKKTKRVLIRKA